MQPVKPVHMDASHSVMHICQNYGTFRSPTHDLTLPTLCGRRLAWSRVLQGRGHIPTVLISFNSACRTWGTTLCKTCAWTLERQAVFREAMDALVGITDLHPSVKTW